MSQQTTVSVRLILSSLVIGSFESLYVAMQKRQCSPQSAQLGSTMGKAYRLFAMLSLPNKSLHKLWYAISPRLSSPLHLPLLLTLLTLLSS
jgi:hypothetical protein